MCGATCAIGDVVYRTAYTFGRRYPTARWPGTTRNLFDDEQRLAIFNRLAVVDENLRDGAADFRLDFIQQFHRLDDAERVAWLDCRPLLDERGCAGTGRSIEGAHHRRLRPRDRGALRLQPRVLGSPWQAGTQPRW